MSITFYSDAPETTTLVKEHCLCAQMAEGFMGDATPEALRAAANPRCAQCGGSGVEEVPQTDGERLNFANANGIALLRALRLGMAYTGDITIAEARRAIIRARAGSLEPFVRLEEKLIGKPVVRADGAIEARPVRMHSAGLDVDGLKSRLDAFEAFVGASEARGAKMIHWS
jgi:hypothetical protein